MKQVNNCQLYLGDCLKIMFKIPDNSVDMVLCDLPYGTTNCSWDVVIPFDELWKHYKRVCKDNSAIVLFGSEPFSSKLRISNLKMYKYDWIWKKSNKSTGFLNDNREPLRAFETIIVLGVEKWTCPSCGCLHDRDKNAAKNIFKRGHKQLYRAGV